MDSGLEERILPSIRRSQMLLIYRNGGVANPETCGHIACKVEVIRRMETCGLIACTVGRLPIRFTVGTGSTIRSFTVGTGGTIIDKHRRHGQFFVGRNPPLLRTPPNGFLDSGVANRMPFPSPVRACKRGAHGHPPLRGGLRAGGHRWRPAVRSRARSGDYPSVSRWAQAARSG